MFFKRYDKGIIEPYALCVISKSFDSKYAEFYQPKDTDDFDYISPDGLHAVEVVLIISDNETKAYQYENELQKGKKNLDIKRIKDIEIKADGILYRYYGGSLGAIVNSIRDTIRKKSRIAKKRNATHQFETIDSCVCVQDGSLMDVHSYQIADFDFSDTPFDNIFFITPSYFFRYTKASGFEEYPLLNR